MNAALAVVTKANPNIKTVNYVQKDSDTLASDLAAAIATGSGPDLVLSSQENLKTLQKFITPIPFASFSASTFNNTFTQGASVFDASSGYYGVPFLIDPLVLFYNRSILSSTGVAKPPTTWEALTGLVPTIATLTPTRQVTRALIALGTYDNVHDARGILSSLFLQTGVPISAYSSSGLLSANLGVVIQNGAPPGQAVVGFYTQFADPSKVSYTWNASLPDSQQSFLAGDLALYLGYVSESSYLFSANPNLNFAAATLPQPATAQTKNVYGLIYALMLPRGAKNPSGAFQVAALLAGPSEQTAAAAAAGLAPANINVLGTAPADPTAAIAYSEALYTSGWLSPAPSDTDSVFSSMINDVITGRSNLQTALTTAQGSLSALLQQ
jgi:multiple sugar transport system substrate-binding protein